jgi:hypothetical protein
MTFIKQKGIKYYTPQEDLVKLLKMELHKRRAIEAGLNLSEDKESERKNNKIDRLKVYYLDKHIFQAMANLIFLFEAMALFPELRKLYEDEVKDLLGVRHDESQQYGFMFRKMLRSMLVIGNEESGTKPLNKHGDFRLKLNHILQGIVLDKVRQHLPNIFNLAEARIAVKDDFHRVWAWAGTLASNINEEEEAPSRTFDFDTNELLKYRQDTMV